MGTPVARLVRASKRFGARIALDDVSLDIHGGELVAIAGLNGAGKTTAIRILMGLVRADSGEYSSPNSSGSSVRPRPGSVGYLPEESMPFLNFTPREILTTSLELADTPAKQISPRASEWLERCGIAEAADLRSRFLSKGMLRRLGLAVALSPEPELIVLDEPQSGLDPLGRADLAAIVHDLRGRNRAVLLASHDLAEIDELADRVILLHRGRILHEFLPVVGAGPDRFPNLRRDFLNMVRAADGLMKAGNSRA